MDFLFGKGILYVSRRSPIHLFTPFFRLQSHDYIRGVGPVIALWGIFYLSNVAVSHEVTWQGLIPSKLLKYMPVDAGGNIQFPLTIMQTLGWRRTGRTRWNSFDQRSYFPHTDRFKLRTAIIENNLSLLKTILDRGKVEINAPLTDQAETPPLGVAAMLGRTQVMEYLRDRGADLDAKDKQGNTPLMLAVIHQQDSALQFLIESGADLSATDNYGYTALAKASNRGFPSIESYLSQQSQHRRAITVNPITPTLEGFAYLRKPAAKDYIKKFDPAERFIGQEYPFYKSTQGMLVCMFGNFEVMDIRHKLRAWTAPNPLDEKASTNQDFLTFGTILLDRMEQAAAMEKLEKDSRQGKGA